MSYYAERRHFVSEKVFMQYVTYKLGLLCFSTFILCVRERPVLQGSVIGPKLWHTRKQIQPYALQVFEVWIFSLYYQHLKYR